eukprot:TRINITY_DN6715_c0_g1_i1.p1 TRINITY_DN6715_c0_g1~~TRINITY_DN6715_c0_g1_i1.p1  ORF type:complete len:284 (-),score=72.28 TRINITY_DN6715_c0_g1_i1:262-1113(-)
MDDDYAELLARPPPFAGTTHFSVRLKALPVFSAVLALSTVLVAGVLFGVTGKIKELPGTGVRLPTVSRLGAYPPGCYVFAGGMHLGAIVFLLLVWAVRLAHTQRLRARTGLEKYDSRGAAARRCADAACAVGTAFSALWFLAGSVPPLARYDGVAAAQDRAHVTVAALGIAALAAYAAIVCSGVLLWARGVFLLSETDVFWFRWKLWCLAVLVGAALSTWIAVPIQNRWFPDGADCSQEWCRQASIQAVGEYVMFPAAVLFIFSLKHDLASVHGNLTVERVFL